MQFLDEKSQRDHFANAAPYSCAVGEVTGRQLPRHPSHALTSRMELLVDPEHERWRGIDFHRSWQELVLSAGRTAAPRHSFCPPRQILGEAARSSERHLGTSPSTELKA